MEFVPVRTRRTFEAAVEQIADAIRLGELHAGDRLPPERTVAAQMGISRPTLREAVRVLVAAGVLEVRPGAGGGMVVARDVVPRDLVDRTSRLRLGEVAGVLEARRLFEPRVAQLAARHATPEDLAAMERTIGRQRALLRPDGSLPPGGEDRFLTLDLQFHLAIARATGNPTVVKLMRTLLRDLEIARDMALHDDALVPAWTVGIHERTLAAIRGGDPDVVARVMDEHLGSLERTWARESGGELVREVPGFLRPSGAPASPAS